MSFSSESFEPVDGRPAHWPHAVPEHKLPEGIEQRLHGALAALAGDSRHALVLCQEAVAIARAQDEDGTLARTLFNAAGVVQLSGHIDGAYLLCLEAQALLERRDDRWRATRILLLRGQCWLDVGEHERAARLIADAMERFRLMQSVNDVARAMTAMAMARRQAGQLDDAVDWAERAVAMLGSGQPAQGERDLDLEVELDLVACGAAAQIRLDRARLREGHGDAAGARAELALAAALLPGVERIAAAGRRLGAGGAFHPLVALFLPVAVATAAPAALPRAMRLLARPPGVRRTRGLAWLELALVQQRRGRHAGALAAARASVRHLDAATAEPRRVEACLLLGELLERAGDARAAYESFDLGFRIEAEQQRASIALRAEMLALERNAERELLSNEQTFAYAQRLSNVGHLVASVNHELNQPMASIRMEAETALALIERGQREEAVDSMRAMARLSARLTDLTAQLAAFPVQSAASVRPVGVRHAVSEALAVLRSHLDKVPCEIVLDFDDALVRAQESQLVRVIANIVHNALDAQDKTPRRRIVFRCATGGDAVVLSISDNGPGLAPAVRDRLFQPFFSTKAAGKGLGLGLALSRDVMHEMGGQLSARNVVDGGAVFDLTLRAALPSPDANETSSRNHEST
jgi:signal transduction histidine kinase